MDDWLPERHLARFVVEVIEQLDLSPFVKAYRGSGSAAHHPSVLLGLLIYGYATGVYSSRKLERASYDSVAFRFVAANDHRDHDTIATFRRRFLTEIEQLFVEVLLLARQAGMVKLGTSSLWNKCLIRLTSVMTICLRGQFYVEQFESLFLCWRGLCQDRHALLLAVTDGVSGQSGEIGEKRAEAVHRQPVVGFLRGGLSSGGRRDLGLGHGREALGLGRVALVVVEQHRRERPAHVPFEMIGQHAEENMGAHARADPVMDRADLDVDGLQAAEGALDTARLL